MYPGCRCDVVNAEEGAMYEFGSVKLSGIDNKDGTSNTLLLGEVGNGMNWFAGWSWEVQRVASAGVDRAWPNTPGMCPLEPEYNAPLYGPQSGLGFGSYHPGGANFAFCDGSVKFVKSTTDLRVLAALATRAGGEVVSASDF
jgi:prepilin-type processing-associated H-X9-DG protein